MVFSQIYATSLREQVVEQIRTAIIEGRLKAGDHIPEITLTQQLGVSRTPVREALILLEQDGLVVSYPHRGCFVRDFTVKGVDDIFSMRITLENFAGELIIEKLVEADYVHLEEMIQRQESAIGTADFQTVRSIDMNFHRYLIQKSQHDLLIRNWQAIVAPIAAVLYLRAESIPNYNENLVVRDHTAIVQAYRRRDLAGLMELNRQINGRVAGECKDAVEKLSKPAS